MILIDSSTMYRPLVSLPDVSAIASKTRPPGVTTIKLSRDLFCVLVQPSPVSVQPRLILLSFSAEISSLYWTSFSISSLPLCMLAEHSCTTRHQNQVSDNLTRHIM